MHCWLQTLKAWSQRRNGLNSTQLAVELSWVLKSDHIASGDVITLDAQPMLRIAELVTTGSNELRWVTGCDHSARSDSTQPVELSSVWSGFTIWAETGSNGSSPRQYKHGKHFHYCILSSNSTYFSKDTTECTIKWFLGIRQWTAELMRCARPLILHFTIWHMSYIDLRVGSL